MTARFYLLLALVSILVMGWVALHYQFEQAKKSQLEDLVSYPIYAYVADTSKVSPLLSDLQRFPELDSLKHETGAQAGSELVGTYSLPLSPELVSGFEFPDLITLRFKALPNARFARHSVLSTLRQYIPEEDMDQQSIAWNNSEAKLKDLGGLSLMVDILIGFLILWVVIFGRLVYEQLLLLLQKRKSVSVVDYLRFKAQTNRHTLTICLVPLILSFGIYYILIWQNVLQMIIPLWFMGAVAGTLLIATLIVMILLHLMDHDNRYHDGEISVVSSEKTPAMDTIIHHPGPQPQEPDKPQDTDEPQHS